MILVALTVMAAQIGLAARLAFLHLGPNEEYKARVTRTRKMEKQMLVGRGRILDRNGETLAIDLAVNDVCADPKVIVENGHVRFIASHLSRLLKLDPHAVISRLNRPKRRFEYIKRFVPLDLAKKVASMQFPGIFFLDSTHRNYPHGPMMCHVVGFSNLEGVGSAGVEQELNQHLKGSPGLRITELDGRRREIYDRRILDIPGQEGADVYLTLDLTIQYMVEKALEQAAEENHAKGAWAVVQRVRTGEILAMASYPQFDLNGYRTSTPEQRRNRAVSYNYEPGSTFKVAVIASALDAGVVTPDRVYDCENGCWMYKGRPLRDYHAYEELTVADILKKSSNIGAAKIALDLGAQRLEAYLREFGVGKSTQINLPGEEHGILHPVSRWSAISATRIAMGHEVAVTALQMLNIVSAIANDGFLMKPLIVKRVLDPEGREIFSSEPEVLGRPINAETAATMVRLMARVTDKDGTGRRAALDEYRVAGKTGSAQKPVAGGYSDSAHMASFVGFLPAEHPEISIIVVVDEPQPLHTGGVVAAPVFSQIAGQAVRYLAARQDGWDGGRSMEIAELAKEGASL
jgi:cell division protein FtsI (penicillin-binding protein 3)